MECRSVWLTEDLTAALWVRHGKDARTPPTYSNQKFFGSVFVTDMHGNVRTKYVSSSHFGYSISAALFCQNSSLLAHSSRQFDMCLRIHCIQSVMLWSSSIDSGYVTQYGTISYYLFCSFYDFSKSSFNRGSYTSGSLF